MSRVLCLLAAAAVMFSAASAEAGRCCKQRTHCHRARHCHQRCNTCAAPAACNTCGSVVTTSCTSGCTTGCTSGCGVAPAVMATPATTTTTNAPLPPQSAAPAPGATDAPKAAQP